jgi:hypothetical protein
MHGLVQLLMQYPVGGYYLQGKTATPYCCGQPLSHVQSWLFVVHMDEALSVRIIPSWVLDSEQNPSTVPQHLRFPLTSPPHPASAVRLLTA